ncbi:helix-turn-helix domain-containing protein [Lysinibacillus sphaericus]|nr:helix-turn-helix transcriptional regulator [Lysinibacillus sp. SDF0037]
MTQEELAEKCGLQTSYLASVERGGRNMTILKKRADYDLAKSCRRQK